MGRLFLARGIEMARTAFRVVHTNITDQKKSGGINFGKDYSMITD